MKQTLMIPYMFVLMNWAAVVSLFHFLRKGKGVGKDIWTTPLPSHSHAPHRIAEQTGTHRKHAA